MRLTDSSRASSLALATRPIQVTLWYPTVDGATTRAMYAPSGALVDTMIARGYFEVSRAIMDHWRSMPIEAQPDARPARSPLAAGWPVLVLSPGFGVSAMHYTGLATGLASHGYVVAVLDHPNGGFALGPGGRLLAPGVDSSHYPDRPLARLVRDWALDARVVLGALAARGGNRPAVDSARVGYLGHSLGGAAALEACIVAAAFRACANMDGAAFGASGEQSIGKPFLVLLSEPDRRGQAAPRDSAEAARRAAFLAMGRERDAEWNQIGDRNGAVPWHAVKLVGTGHLTFSDAPFQLPNQLEGVGATTPPRDAHMQTLRLLLEFFGHYLGTSPLSGLRVGLHAFP